jgi:hypothetical protein
MAANKHLLIKNMTMTIKAVVFGLSLFHGAIGATDLYYYDGITKRTLVMDSQQWASVKGGVTGKSVELRSLTANEKSAIGKTSTNTIVGSPVYRSGETGAPMALPGGIIVKPKAGDTNAEGRLKAKGFEIERPIGGSGALLIKSTEGTATLEIANKLHESGEFESATPNWWRERRKK